MAPRPKPWFRFYTEAVHDRKIRRLKPEQRWMFVACLCLARASCVPGELLVSATQPMDDADLIDAMAMPAPNVKRGLVALEEAGLIDRNGTVEGAWRVVAWDERQYEGAASTSTRRGQILRDGDLRKAIRNRDGDDCQYCGVTVDWKDRRGPRGGTYDHVEPRGANDLANLVVACRSCNAKKGSRNPAEAKMKLRPRSDLDRPRSFLPPETETETDIPKSLKTEAVDNCPSCQGRGRFWSGQGFEMNCPCVVPKVLTVVADTA